MRPYESHCETCPVVAECPEWKRLAMAQALLHLVRRETLHQSAIPEVTNLDEEGIAAVTACINNRRRNSCNSD